MKKLNAENIINYVFEYLANRDDILFAYLFGSYAKSKQTHLSDIDIPNSYADSFSVLAENGVVDNNRSHSLEKMAKFRNVVVHDYDRVDAEIVIGILKKNLDDFTKFKVAVVSFLKGVEKIK